MSKDKDVGRSGADAPSGCQPTASAAISVASSQSGIPNAALCLNIPITPELSAAAAGELLLSYINDQERWGYSTHEFLRGDFRRIDGLPPLDVRTICCGCWANSPGEGDAINWWRSDALGLDVFLHWDGDGTVVFKHPFWTLENGDCKNDHDWEWVGPGHWATDYRHYEDDASAIEARRAETVKQGSVHESAVPKGDAQNG